MQDKPINVLLIEEEPMLREITSFRLELLGYRVECVESAEQALDRLSGELPDLMIVGHFLPGMSGIELIDRVSNDIRTSSVPVMLLSPNADLDHVQRAYTAGAKEYLVAPYDPMVLQDKIHKLASRRPTAT
ncbi:Phosphate regulon transcriptional regulatory protein PhoB [Posidoniimonas polymericola]|uniref:Phosphate regulon transcriptional regulatory protein PhoB n=1 Tax=Posidoniimonas polymericola TaxID=2528002 RepID=A0A5C5XWC9_9BACT|nr:response regulator [Posidoniimonas polymericola]TWT66295.1 Phosphate regulon transcriptional regulatory protein PhoB [Posidoniimonas polymericola]